MIRKREKAVEKLDFLIVELQVLRSIRGSCTIQDPEDPVVMFAIRLGPQAVPRSAGHMAATRADVASPSGSGGFAGYRGSRARDGRDGEEIAPAEARFPDQALAIMVSASGAAQPGRRSRPQTPARSGVRSWCYSTRTQPWPGSKRLMWFTTLPVRGPRFFWSTTPLWLQMKLITPVRPHCSGQASIAKPAIMLPLIT